MGLRARMSDERGQTALSILLMTLGVFIFAALALDAGLWYFHHRTVQNQADAAAHAAVLNLPESTAEATASAIAWLKQNGVPDPVADAAEVGTGTDCGDMAIASGQDGRAKILFSDANNAVKVCLRMRSGVFLSGLAGITEAIVSASAKARVQVIPSPYSLMSMYPGGCLPQAEFWATGSGAGVRVTGGGSTYTDSSCCPNALSATGGGVIESGGNDVPNGCGQGSGITPPPNTEAEDLDDPFAQLQDPPVSGINSMPCRTQDASGQPIPNTINSGTWELLPGRYCTGLKASNNPTIRLRPGIYIMQGDLELGSNVNFTSDLNSNGTLESTEEVLIYATCNPHPCGTAVCSPSGSVAPRLQFPGQAMLWLRGHSSYERILIWVDRTSRYFSTVSLSGGATGRLDGRLYALCSFVDFTGSSTGNLTVNMSMVAGTFKFSGNGLVSIPYDPILAPPLRIIALVE
ncbi:MAG TPA: pilus assembly protein TadG-related protein [Dehalococcoidia bacterium]|nr:pilus assembly protein TadG-related protein [Dehalococcoidia bacterium]